MANPPITAPTTTPKITTKPTTSGKTSTPSAAPTVPPTRRTSTIKAIEKTDVKPPITNGNVLNGNVSNGRVASENPFKYGWRERSHYNEEGRLIVERTPLTSYDILHPQEGDFRVHNHEHMRICNYLVNVVESRVAHDPHAVVLHDTLVAWGSTGPRPHGPDIALIFGVREVQGWGTFDVNSEGTRPTLIIEVTSPETRDIDLDDKPAHYAQAGVQYYIIVDTHVSRRQPTYQLIGRQLTASGYTFMEPNGRGWLWITPLQIWIGLNQNRLECYDVDGNRIGDYVDIVEQLDEATLRVERERRRAEEERRRAEEEQQRAEQERQHAEREQQRAEQEQQRAEREQQDKERALSEVARYREKLRALGIDPDQL